MAGAKLNDAQREQLVAWVQDAFSPRALARLIASEREKGVHRGGEPWPELSDQNLAYYVRHYGGVADANLVQAAFSHVRGTALGKRDVHAKRLARRIEEIDALIDALEARAWLLIDEGVLRGVLYAYDDGPGVLEVDYAVDGDPHRPVPIRREPPLGPERRHPRWDELQEVFVSLTKLYGAHERYMQAMARVAGLAPVAGQSPAAEATPVSRQERASATLDKLLATLPRKHA